MHSFVSCLTHCVFATKERRPLIKAQLQQRLWPYLGGIARESQMRALIVGGAEDHVHVLFSIPSTLSVSKAVQLLKGNSSKWIHDTFQGALGVPVAGGLWAMRDLHAFVRGHHAPGHLHFQPDADFGQKMLLA